MTNSLAIGRGACGGWGGWLAALDEVVDLATAGLVVVVAAVAMLLGRGNSLPVGMAGTKLAVAAPWACSDGPRGAVRARVTSEGGGESRISFRSGDFSDLMPRVFGALLRGAVLRLFPVDAGGGIGAGGSVCFGSSFFLGAREPVDAGRSFSLSTCTGGGRNSSSFGADDRSLGTFVGSVFDFAAVSSEWKLMTDDDAESVGNVGMRGLSSDPSFSDAGEGGSDPPYRERGGAWYCESCDSMESGGESRSL